MPSEQQPLPSLYRRVLGSKYGDLPAVLQQLHDRTESRARGLFVITRGRGPVRNLVATCAGFPRAGTDVPVELRVTTEGNRERWSRDFGGCKLVTVQWEHNGLLIEASGPVCFAFELTANPTSMRFTTRRGWLLGIPLPGWFTPRATAVATGRANGWSVIVQIHFPVLGLMVEYAGDLKLDEETLVPLSPQSIPARQIS